MAENYTSRFTGAQIDTAIEKLNNKPLAVQHGGTGRTSLAADSFLAGNGTSAVKLLTPAEVLTKIGAVPLSGSAMTGPLSLKNLNSNGGAEIIEVWNDSYSATFGKGSYNNNKGRSEYVGNEVDILAKTKVKIDPALGVEYGGTGATDKVTAGKNLCETGNWTPTLIGYAGTNPTYTTTIGFNGNTGRAYGYYVRIGRLIFVHCDISCQISDVGTGYACVSGLPYAPALNTPLTLNETYNCVTISSELEKPTLRVLTEGVLIKSPNGSGTYKWKKNSTAGGCLLSFSGVYTTDA